MSEVSEPETFRGLKWKATLFAILVLAAVLRVWGAGYGLPHPVTRPDEERIVGRAHTIFATGNWHTGSPVYPSLVYYLDTGALYVYYAAQKILGRYDRPFDFLLDVALHRPGLHYRVARSVGILSGTLTVGLVYLLSVAAYRSRAAGLFAAGLVAVSLVHVIYSHFATVDAVMTLLVTATLWAAVRAFRDPSYRSFAVAGFFAGLSVSAKYNAGLVVLSIALAGVLCWRDKRLGLKGAVGRLSVAASASALSFAASSPFVVSGLGALLWEMNRVSGVLYDPPGHLALWQHLRITLPGGMGLFAFALAALGTIRAIYLRRPADWILLAFLLPFFAIISSVTVVFPRYVLPLVPGLAVLAADTGRALLERLPKRRAFGWTALAAFSLGPPLLDSVRYDRIASRSDTRVMATEYLERNASPQNRILICDGYGAPDVNTDRRRPPAFIVESIRCQGNREAEAVDGDFLVTHEHPDLTMFSTVHPSWHEWLAANAELLHRVDPFNRESTTKPFFFVADGFYLPYSGFEGLVRGGPIVEIWKLTPPP